MKVVKFSHALYFRSYQPLGKKPLESYSLKQNLVQFVLIFVLNTDLLFYKNQTQGVGTLPKYSKFNESVYAEKTFTLGLF